jgi:hypothetical protein
MTIRGSRRPRPEPTFNLPYCFWQAVFRYKFMYIHERPFETSGSMWPHELNRMFAILNVYIIFMAAIFGLQKGEFRYFAELWTCLRGNVCAQYKWLKVLRNSAQVLTEIYQKSLVQLLRAMMLKTRTHAFVRDQNLPQWCSAVAFVMKYWQKYANVDWLCSVFWSLTPSRFASSAHIPAMPGGNLLPVPSQEEILPNLLHKSAKNSRGSWNRRGKSLHAQNSSICGIITWQAYTVSHFVYVIATKNALYRIVYWISKVIVPVRVTDPTVCVFLCFGRICRWTLCPQLPPLTTLLLWRIVIPSWRDVLWNLMPPLHMLHNTCSQIRKLLSEVWGKLLSTKPTESAVDDLEMFECWGCLKKEVEFLYTVECNYRYCTAVAIVKGPRQSRLFRSGSKWARRPFIEGDQKACLLEG